jgi:hypothetical protein
MERQEVKRPRPYIPISVRVQVARRQWMLERFDDPTLTSVRNLSESRQLAYMLGLLFVEHPELDHDPALENRQFNPKTGKYKPDANDPRYLIYREKLLHLQKTTGRRPGAERTVTSKGSDNWLAKKFRKLEGKQKPKAQIPSRPFPKRRAKNAAR